MSRRSTRRNPQPLCEPPETQTHADLSRKRRGKKPHRPQRPGKKARGTHGAIVAEHAARREEEAAAEALVSARKHGTADGNAEAGRNARQAPSGTALQEMPSEDAKADGGLASDEVHFLDNVVAERNARRDPSASDLQETLSEKTHTRESLKSGEVHLLDDDEKDVLDGDGEKRGEQDSFSWSLGDLRVGVDDLNKSQRKTLFFRRLLLDLDVETRTSEEEHQRRLDEKKEDNKLRLAEIELETLKLKADLEKTRLRLQSQRSLQEEMELQEVLNQKKVEAKKMLLEEERRHKKELSLQAEQLKEEKHQKKRAFIRSNMAMNAASAVLQGQVTAVAPPVEARSSYFTPAAVRAAVPVSGTSTPAVNPSTAGGEEESSMSPASLFGTKMRRYQSLLEDGLISAEDFARLRDEAREKYLM
eukprot:scaffold803_cov310-Pinguiococcus_pyrenoidosus.AAC.144